uniref:UhbW1 protein n=1 Tax=Ganoderma boninense TaxID=34458 RepID=A0A5K1JRG6_9APHY|nr:UhbW1 protein [Ganoderma boninense]
MRLKSLCESQFDRRCQSSPQLSRDPKFVSLFVGIYNKAIKDYSSFVLDDVTPRVLNAQASLKEGLSRTTLPLKRPFNHNALPTLERFFDGNAFPSRLEKYELASICDMTFKQINDWFQNRRTRFKREGKPLKERDVKNTLLLELENSVVDVLLPQTPDEDGKLLLVQKHNSDSLPTSVSPLLSTHAPPHAFPASYPALCPYDPFPIAPSKRALDLPWLRSPRNGALEPTSPVSISQLTAEFARLTITQDPANQGSEDSDPTSSCDEVNTPPGSPPVERLPVVITFDSDERTELDFLRSPSKVTISLPDLPIFDDLTHGSCP